MLGPAAASVSSPPETGPLICKAARRLQVAMPAKNPANQMGRTVAANNPTPTAARVTLPEPLRREPQAETNQSELVS